MASQLHLCKIERCKMTFRDAATAMMLTTGLASLGESVREALNLGNKVDSRFWKSWTTLKFTTHPYLLFTAGVEIRRREGAGLLALDTATSSHATGNSPQVNRTRTTVDQTTGRLIETWKISDSGCTRFLYSEDHVTVEVLAPKETPESTAEAADVLSRWKYPIPLDPTSGRSSKILDFAALILQLPNEPLFAVGQSTHHWLATSTGPQEVKVQVIQERNNVRTCQDMRVDKQRTLQTKELLLKISDRGVEPENKQLVGMAGPVWIWVEAESRTPLELDGRLPHLKGHLELGLSGIATS
jgi:hypothetical protein